MTRASVSIPDETALLCEGCGYTLDGLPVEQLGKDQPIADEPSPPRPAFVARHSMSSMSDPQWLKGRRGPAATAYRRLRRLFPG